VIFARRFYKRLRTSFGCLHVRSQSVNKHKQSNADNILGQHDYLLLLFPPYLSAHSESFPLTQTGCHNDVDADADVGAYLNVKSFYLVRICLESDMVV